MKRKVMPVFSHLLLNFYDQIVTSNGVSEKYGRKRKRYVRFSRIVVEFSHIQVTRQ